MVIESISKDLLPFYEEFLKGYVKLEKGNPNLSRSFIIYYDETVTDVYNLVHEFLHRYSYLSRYENKDKNDMDIFYVIDEAKSIYSEEIVSNFIRENKDSLNINIDELEEIKFKRMFSERKSASIYVYLFNIRNYFSSINDKKKRISSSDIESYFSSFDKSSIEYLSFKENFNSNLVNELLKRNENFFNDKFYSIYLHPFSYMLSLKLSKDNADLYNLSNKLRSTDNSLLDSFVFKDARIDKNSINELKVLLEEKYNEYLSYNEIRSRHM